MIVLLRDGCFTKRYRTTTAAMTRSICIGQVATLYWAIVFQKVFIEFSAYYFLRVREKVRLGKSRIGSVAPAARTKMTVMATMLLKKNISIYLCCPAILSRFWRNMICAKNILYAYFPGIIGRRAGIESTVIGVCIRFPSQSAPKPIVSEAQSEPIAILIPHTVIKTKRSACPTAARIAILR